MLHDENSDDNQTLPIVRGIIETAISAQDAAEAHFAGLVNESDEDNSASCIAADILNHADRHGTDSALKTIEAVWGCLVAKAAQDRVRAGQKAIDALRDAILLAI